MSYRFDCDAPNWPKGLNQMTSKRMKKTHGPVSRLFLQLRVYTVHVYIYINIFHIFSYTDTFLKACHVLCPLDLPTRGVLTFSGFGSLQKRQVNLWRLPLSHVLGFSLDKMRIC